MDKDSASNPQFEPHLLSPVNSSPNDNFLDWSKLKAFADEKLNLAKKLKFFLGRVENMMVTSIFSFSHNVLKRHTSYTVSFKVVIVW